MENYAQLKQFKKSNVNGLTKFINGFRWKDEFIENDSYRANMTKIVDELKKFGLEIDYNNSHLMAEKFLFSKPRKITKEQTELGKNWLKNHFFTSKGIKRRGKNTEYVGERVLNISKNVSRFEFVGVLLVMSNGWSLNSVLPIYRTFNRKGEYFDYAPVHWGQPVIMEG